MGYGYAIHKWGITVSRYTMINMGHNYASELVTKWVFLQVWRGGQTDAMTGPDHSTGGGDVEQMDRGTRSHTAQGRTRSGYSSLFYNIL